MEKDVISTLLIIWEYPLGEFGRVKSNSRLLIVASSLRISVNPGTDAK